MLIYLQLIESDDDRLLFEELYLKYSKMMFFIALKILENETDAEDAVHQAFLAVIDSLDKISDINDSRTKSFMAIVARNKALDIFRKNSVREYCCIDELDVPDPLGIPEENTLACCIAGLPQKMRDIILLRYDNGFSTSEIAQMLGMKRSAVQKCIERARKKLAECMEKIQNEE